jgi:glycosyltransferase involved in cell wall biosynthesis
MGKENSTRLLLVCETLDAGGAERQVATDANLLAANGWDVTLAFWAGGSFVSKISPQVKCHLIRSKSWFGRWLDLYWFCRQQKFNVIHSHLTGANLIASVVGRLVHTPVIVTEHGLGLWRLKEFKFRVAVSLTYHFANKIVSVCEATRNIKVAREGADPKKSLVIHNSYDPSVVSQELEDDQFLSSLQIPKGVLTVGYVGRLIQVKRLDLLVRIAIKVIERIPGVCFLIVGDGPERTKLQSIVGQHGIDDAFRFVGSQSNVAQFYRLMDVFVLTSEREALSISLLEAMASSLPVVVFDVGGNSEVVLHGETGYVAPFPDCDCFSGYLIKLLSQDYLRVEMGTKAKLRSESMFSPVARLAALETLYANVCQRHNE